MRGPAGTRGAGAGRATARGAKRGDSGRHRRAEVERTRSGAPVAHVEGHELKLSNLDKVLYPAAGFPRAS